MNTYEINDRNEVIQYKLDDICKQRDEAYAMLRRIARKGEFMDMEGQRLVVFDWLARRHISSENDRCDTPRTDDENKLKAVTEQRDRLEIIAGQLIAMIRMNVIGRTFEECTIEQIDKHLKPWIDEIAAVKGGSDE